MNITIDLKLDLSLDEDTVHQASTVAEAIEDQAIPSSLYEEIVEAVSEHCVEAYCGEKHAHGNGEKRHQRAGTDDKTITTTLGEHELDLHYVKDTADDEYFRPVEDVIAFDGQNTYQEGIAIRAAKAATKLSYRDAAEQVAEFGSEISRSTIQRRVKRFGGELREFLHDANEGMDAQTVMADGTKCHSQQEGVSYNNVHIALNRDVVGDDGETTLLDVTVDGSWDRTAQALRDEGTIAEEATIVSDAEETICNAFCVGDVSHQLDLVHQPRTMSYHLWDDDAFSLAERKQIVSELSNDLFHLKHSVAIHAPVEEDDAMKRRLEITRDRLGRLSRQLDQLGSPKAAAYLREWRASTLRFAEFALNGRLVPWTSNAVERAMGEVSKRCKNTWMSWTATGLEALLTLNLVRYANPGQFDQFEAAMLNRSTKTALTMEVSADTTRGEL